EIAVCCEARNALICGAAGNDCCSELYCMLTAVSEVGTPVMVDKVALISAKLRTPMSGDGGLSVGGATTGVGSVNPCVDEPSWSNDRKTWSVASPLSEGMTAPTLESSWPPAAV